MPKILLVEDEKMLAEMYKEKFEAEGIETILAFTSEEGLEILKKEKIDLILLDILLPRENGACFLRQLKKIKEALGIPILAFSNYDEPGVKKEVLGLGAKKYLIKTQYTPKKIVDEIKKHLLQ
jgi:DNA-binding response OmpR family regulator